MFRPMGERFFMSLYLICFRYPQEYREQFLQQESEGQNHKNVGFYKRAFVLHLV